MPGITAETLRQYLNRDVPGVTIHPHAPPTEKSDADEPSAKGKHTAKKPDFLTTNDTVVLAERLLDVVTYVRDTLGYTYLSDIAIVDYLGDGLLEIGYRFYHLDGGNSLVVKVRLPRDRPIIQSLTPIWPAANFHEREGFDLFGVNFVGHPNLRRIYMWEEFVGHPMRKDFRRQGDKYLGD
jgi:NADH-quinone oxidoreductase subunit C